MFPLATSTFSIYRATGTNDYGDDTDDATTPLYTAVPMSVIEQGRSSNRQASDRPGSAATYTGRAPARTDVRLGDRLQDEKSGAWYVVVDAERLANPIAPVGSTRLHLAKVQNPQDSTLATSTLTGTEPFTIGV